MQRKISGEKGGWKKALRIGGKTLDGLMRLGRIITFNRLCEIVWRQPVVKGTIAVSNVTE